MSLKLSVCGLIVIPDRESQGWECALFREELEHLDLSDALNFTRLRIQEQSLRNGKTGASFIAAAFHPGWEDRCPGIEYADQPVNSQEEFDNPADPGPFTVCGFYADNWQTYSGWITARSPRMAYLTAYEQEQINGRYLYVANVHRGSIERHSLPGTTEPPAFGDPACRTAEEMDSEMATLLGTA